MWWFSSRSSVRVVVAGRLARFRGLEKPLGVLRRGLLRRSIVNLLSGRGERELIDEPVCPWSLVGGQHRVLAAVPFAVGSGQRRVRSHHVGHYELPPFLVRHADHHRVP